MCCWGSHCMISTRPPMSNTQKDRHIVRSALQNSLTALRSISQEIGIFAACPMSARTMRRHLQQPMSYQYCDYYCGFTCQYSLEWSGDSGKSNNKAGYRSCTMSSVQMSLGSVCSIGMAYTCLQIIIIKIATKCNRYSIEDLLILEKHFVFAFREIT